MIKYEIYYRDTKIGELEINDEGKHRYTPDFLGVEIIKPIAPINFHLTTKTTWIEPIPFFQIPILDAIKFSQEDDIRSHTDNFRMIKVE